MKQKSIILIVDDEKIGREALEGLLMNQGYELVFASDGSEALIKAVEVMPDIILLDVMMPDMDGFEVCRTLREDAFLAEVPIIMVTALDDRDSRLQGIEAGADDFIIKPFDRIELRARIRTITHLNRYRRLLLEQEKFVWVIEQAQEAYLVLSPDDQVMYANRQARLYLNLDLETYEPITDYFFSLAGKNYHCEPQQAWAHWLEPDHEHTPRYLVHPETYTSTAFWLRVEILKASSSPSQEYLIRLRDVTDSVLAERLRWSFQGQINHKFRSALHPVIGMLEYLRINHTKISETNRVECLDIAYEGTLRLEENVEEVLKYLNISEVSQLTQKHCSLQEILTVIDTTQEMLEIETARVVQENINNIEDIIVSISPQAMELILREVIGNAVKFHPRQSPGIEIHIAITSENIRLSIYDDGITLSPEQLVHMWQPYYQGEKYFTGEVTGVGLGLSMVASLIWDVGGNCHAYNRDDKAGVIIEFTLPLAKTHN